MALTVPTIQELTDDIVSQIESSISQTVPLLPKIFTRVLAKVLAGTFILVYKRASWIFLQIFVAYASFDEVTILGWTLSPLKEWGRLVGVGDPEEPTRAELVIDVVVTNQSGTLPAGSQLIRTETGVTYTTIAPRLLDAAVVDVSIVAASDPEGNGGEGTIGNLQVGDTVTFANALANVSRDATVSAQTVVASDGESVDAYRSKIFERFQSPPQGGAYSDYRVWARTVSGIVTAYPYTGDKPGEVDVYIEATEASSGSADGIPSAGQLTQVFDAIQLNVSGKATRRPIGAAVNVRPITRTGLSFFVAGLVVDASARATVETQIAEGIDEFLRSREPYIVGLSVLPRKDRVTVAEVGGIVAGIAGASGGTITSVAMTDGISFISAYTLGKGERAKLGADPFYIA